MSTWITVAPPRGGSVNEFVSVAFDRVPTNSTTSAPARYAFACARAPLAPTTPRDQREPSSIEPLPWIEVATGTAPDSASAARASYAAARCTPPPATITGRRAVSSSRAAASTADCATRSATGTACGCSKSSVLTCSSSRSSGTMSATGAGRPLRAQRSASPTTVGSSAAALTVKISFVSPEKTAAWSISVRAPEPRLFRWMSLVIASTGMLDANASPRPLAR
jgi:hypothetical protein